MMKGKWLTCLNSGLWTVHEMAEVNAAPFLQLTFCCPWGSFGFVPEIGLQVLWQDSLFFARATGTAKMATGSMQCLTVIFHLLLLHGLLGTAQPRALSSWSLCEQWYILEFVVCRSLGSVQKLSPIRQPSHSSAKYEITYRQNTLSYSYIVSQLTYAIFFSSGSRTYQKQKGLWWGGIVSNLEPNEGDTWCTFYIIYITLFTFYSRSLSAYCVAGSQSV